MIALPQDFAMDCADAYAAPAGSPRNEQALMLRYLPLVKRAARHLQSQVVAVFSREDLEQVGLMGLLEALRRYGGEPDEQFESFAFKRIRGAMLDELRRQDWRGRQVRQQAHAFNKVVREQYNRRGRSATEQELADAMQVDLEEVRNLMCASQAEAMQSLEELLEAGGHEPEQAPEFDALEMQLTVKKALSALPEREQRLLSLYYQHELNMKEIALVLGITESRVCQLHKHCVEQLNRQLRDLFQA